MKRPDIKDFTTGGSMLAPHGTTDYEAYTVALEKYIEYLKDAISKTPRFDCDVEIEEGDSGFLVTKPSKTGRFIKSNDVEKVLKNLS